MGCINNNLHFTVSYVLELFLGSDFLESCYR